MLPHSLQAAELSQHFTCYALDLRGQGETPVTDGNLLELFLEDCLTVLQQTGLQGGHLCMLQLLHKPHKQVNIPLSVQGAAVSATAWGPL